MTDKDGWWFAWYPVIQGKRCADLKTVWLKWVWREYYYLTFSERWTTFYYEEKP